MQIGASLLCSSHKVLFFLFHSSYVDSSGQLVSIQIKLWRCLWELYIACVFGWTLDAGAGETVVQWLGCLLCNCENQGLDHQRPLTFWVNVVCHLQFQSQKVGTEDSQSKLASKASHISNSVFDWETLPQGIKCKNSVGWVLISATSGFTILNPSVPIHMQMHTHTQKWKQ